MIENLIPVKGQVGLLAPVSNFPVFLDNELPLYIVPRKDAIIIGGTYEAGITDAVTDAATISRLFENAYKVFPELREQEVIGSWAGIRPYRPLVQGRKRRQNYSQLWPWGKRLYLSMGLCGGSSLAY